jgi:hypothetical protein
MALSNVLILHEQVSKSSPLTCGHIILNDFCLFFLALQPIVGVFHIPVAGFSLRVCEVS